VTQAIYGAGFNSSSRFYERSSDTLGMTPREFQKGGSGVTIQYAVVPCPLGLAMVAGTERGISFVGFGNERTMLEQELKKEFPKATLEKAAKSFHAWVNTIVDYIKHPRDEIKLPLDIRGTAFQQRVWQALREIPVGRTSTYTEVAAKIGRPAAVRAVARACATNPTCVIVPCHRVLRKGGNLSGYRWGLDRKRQLLKREGAL
jgi:AraC family transcriptional regulator of adaptative response/methylated-DNA-[protein]-cysteine methyltransferase